MEKPYEAISAGSDGKPYVAGPGEGCSFHSGHLYPEYRLSTPADSDAAAKIANTAYEQGYKKAQRDIKYILGIK